jgi:surface antigen
VTVPPASPGAPARPAFTWESTENPGTGGASVVTGDSVAPDGRRCRQVASIVIRGGQEQRVSETLCRDPQRGWVPAV